MELKYMRDMLKEKLAIRDFDIYAVCVSKNGEKVSLFPDNADKDTYFTMTAIPVEFVLNFIMSYIKIYATRI